MTMSIQPILSQAAASMPKNQPIQAEHVAIPQVSQITVERLEPSLARWLRLVDRASRIKPAQAVNAYATAVWSRFIGWQTRRVTRLLLNSLDDRALADIGVRRRDINAVLRDIEARKSRSCMNP